MRVTVSGHTGSGKSCVAAMAALLVQEARSPRPRKGQPKELVPAVAIVNEPGAAGIYAGFGFEPEQIVRARSLAGTERALIAAEGGVGVIDACPRLYLQAVAGYLATANRELDRLGRPHLQGVPTSAWSAINERYREVLLTPGVDVVEVHNQAALILADGQGGVVETEGYKPRGRNEGPIAPGLWLRVHGVRSAARERSLVVTVDASGREVGAVRILPDFRGQGDRDAALAMLRQLLAASIADLIRIGDEDAAAWAAHSEPEDHWPTAIESAQSGERARVVETVKQLWAYYGISTNAAKSKLLRGEFLGRHFAGAITEDDLLASPLSLLTAGLSGLQAELAERFRHETGTSVEPQESAA